MAARTNPHDLAAVSAQVRQLAQRYPDTSNAAWIIVIIFGFLLVVPVVAGAIGLCVVFQVNGALGLVVGMAVWLGIFMLLRQAMLWRRNGKVEGLVWAFNATFPPESPSREAALACLSQITGEVVAEARERLGARPRAARRGVLKLGQGYNAGQGLEADSDPVVDRQVEQILRPLDLALRILSVVQWVLGLGVPIAFFVMLCIFDPKGTGLIWATLIVFFVWNIILVFIMALIRTPFTLRAGARLEELFPPGSPQRPIAMASFSRIHGCAAAKSYLRSDLRDEEDSTDGPTARPRAAPTRHAAPAPSAYPALEPQTAAPVVPEPSSPRSAPAMQSGAIPLEPVGVPAAVAPPPPRPAAFQTPQDVPARTSNFCTQCGQGAKPGNRFCTGCGAKLS